MKTKKMLAAAVGAMLGASPFPAVVAADGAPTTVINVYPEGAAAEAPTAEAAEGDHSFSANVALVSNYMFRGQSQTDNGPAIQGGFDYTYNPLDLYVGTWASNVASEGFFGSNVEIDVYGGWRPTFDKLSLDAGVLYYAYPSSNEGGASEVDTLEWKLGATYDFDFLAAGVMGFYSADYFNFGPAHRIELGVTVPLPMDFKLTAKYGWNDSHDSVRDGGYEDYQDWSIGITTDVFGVTVGVAYTDVVSLDDEDTFCAAPFQCGGEFVASISKSF